MNHDRGGDPKPEQLAEQPTGVQMHALLEALLAQGQKPFMPDGGRIPPEGERNAQLTETCERLLEEPWTRTFFHEVRTQLELGVRRADAQPLEAAVMAVDIPGLHKTSRELERRARWTTKGLDRYCTNHDPAWSRRFFPEYPLSLLPLIETGRIIELVPFLDLDTLTALGWIDDETTAEYQRIGQLREMGQLGNDVGNDIEYRMLLGDIGETSLRRFLAQSDQACQEAAQRCYDRLIADGHRQEGENLRLLFPKIPQRDISVPHLFKSIERNGLGGDACLPDLFTEGRSLRASIEALDTLGREQLIQILLHERHTWSFFQNIEEIQAWRLQYAQEKTAEATRMSEWLALTEERLQERFRFLTLCERLDPFVRKIRDDLWVSPEELLDELAENAGHPSAADLCQEAIALFSHHLLTSIARFRTKQGEGFSEEVTLFKKFTVQLLETSFRRQGMAVPEALPEWVGEALKDAVREEATVLGEDTRKPLSKRLYAIWSSFSEVGISLEETRAFLCRVLKSAIGDERILVGHEIPQESAMICEIHAFLNTIGLNDRQRVDLFDAAVQAGEPLLALGLMPRSYDEETLTRAFVVSIDAGLRRRDGSAKKTLASLMFLRRVPDLDQSLLNELTDPTFLEECLFPRIREALQETDGAFAASQWLRYGLPKGTYGLPGETCARAARLVVDVIEKCIESDDSTTLEDFLLKRVEHAASANDPALLVQMETALGEHNFGRAVVAHLERIIPPETRAERANPSYLIDRARREYAS